MISYNCKQIEELILKQTTEILNKDEIKFIKKHIENCPSCKAFKISLTNIEKSMQIDTDTILQPNPEIKETIMFRLQQNSALRKNWVSNFINTTRSIFEYRIPVYQAGLAMIIIVFLITFGLDFSKSIQDKNELAPVYIQNAGIPLNSEYIIENYPDLENQKVGVNVREDSILIGFISTSL